MRIYSLSDTSRTTINPKAVWRGRVWSRTGRPGASYANPSHPLMGVPAAERSGRAGVAIQASFSVSFQTAS